MDRAKSRQKTSGWVVFVVFGVLASVFFAWSGRSMAQDFQRPVRTEKIKILPAGMRGDSDGWENGVAIFSQDLFETAPSAEFNSGNSAYFIDPEADEETESLAESGLPNNQEDETEEGAAEPLPESAETASEPEAIENLTNDLTGPGQENLENSDNPGGTPETEPQNDFSLPEANQPEWLSLGGDELANASSTDESEPIAAGGGGVEPASGAAETLDEETIGGNPIGIDSGNGPVKFKATGPAFEKGFELSRFSVDESIETESISSVQLRFSMAAAKPLNEPTEPNFLRIEYSIGGSDWIVADRIDLNREVSNKDNGGYFLEALPAISGFDELESLQLKFTYEANSPGTGQSVYVDAVWLEALYTPLPEKKELISEWRQQIVDRLFSEDQNPEFVFDNLENKKNFLQKIWAWIKREERTASAQLIDPTGEETTTGITIDGESVKIERDDARKFRPGKYTLIVTVKEGDKEVSEEQSFEWGVLTVNSDKSIYKTGDEANLFFGVLDEYGHTICDARIVVSVTDPSGNTTYPDVAAGEECGADNITDKPDYSAKYQTAGPGTYQIDVVANSASGTVEITDSFEVMDSVEFDVTRDGPTRINPEGSYRMRIKVIPSQDYSGQVVEYMPSDFEILESEWSEHATSTGEIIYASDNATPTQETAGDLKKISWEAQMLAGHEYEFVYSFDAPDISPYIFLLGPLQIGDFYELRQWQIASDAFTPRTETYVNVSSLTTPFDATISKPTSCVDGDIIFVWIGWYAATTIDSAPSGWTKLGDYVANTDRYALYYKVASGEGTGWTWSFAATAKVRMVASCYTSGDFNSTSPIDQFSNTSYRTSNTTVQAAAMNVTYANSPLIMWASVYSTLSRTFTPPSNIGSDAWTEDDDAGSTTPDFWTEVNRMTWTGYGSTGAINATVSSSTTTKHAFAVSLTPANPVITVSGGCFTDATEATACTDNANDAIKVAVNGVVQANSDTTVDGSWSFTIDKPASGATLVFFRDGETTESNEATTVVKYDGVGSIDLVKMYQSQLVIGTDSGSINTDQTVSISDMDTATNGYENSDDEDVLYDVTSGSDLTVDASGNKSETLYVISGDTYRPASGGGGDTTTHNLYIEGTVTADNNTINIAGDLTKTGTYNYNTGTTTFNASTGPWPYRKAITLSGQSGAGTGFQVLLNIGESSGATGEDFDLESHATNFPNDLMFTDNDGYTSLSYWVQETSGTTPNRLAKVWVKVNDDLGSNTTIYVYYGKTGAASASSGDNTFIFFDDFDDASLNSSKWVNGYYATYCTAPTEASGYLRLSCNNNGSYKLYNYVGSQSAYDLPFTIETKVRMPSSNVWNSTVYGTANTMNYDTGNNLASQRFSTLASLSAPVFWVNGTSATTAELTADTWYESTQKLYSGSSTSAYGGSSWNNAGTFSQTSAYIRINIAKWVAYSAQFDTDWIFARKYAATEPDYSSADTEESGTAITQIIPDETFYNLNINPAVDSGNAIFESGTLTVNGSLGLGNGTNTGVNILASAGDPNITVAGDMTVNANTTFTGSDSSSATLNIDGALTITGTFVAPPTTGATNFTLGGNFVNNGTFTHNSGRITLDGNGGANNQTLSGSTTPTTFYQFYITAGGTRSVSFTNGNHYAIADNGTLNLAGTASFGLTVTRSGTSSAWYLDVSTTNTTVSIVYTTAAWSNASGGKEINATGGTNTDGNNNTNWVFVISNYPPTWSTHPHEDPTSDTSTPTGVGTNFVVKATAADTESNQYYLAVCKTNAISANNNSEPTCTGGSWAISAATNAGSEATASYTVLASDTSESYAWYAFACDKNTTQYGCTSMDNDGTSGNNGTPFAVNHRPTFTTVADSGAANPGGDVTITAESWGDSDDDGAQDTGSMYVCKDDDFTGSACGAAGEWCSVTGVTPPLGAWLSNYAYRVKIPVSATTAGTQTDYTLPLTIVKGSGSNTAGTIYLNDHALNWPIDIRFTKSDGTSVINYYREEYDATDGTWNVRLDYIDDSGTTDFYMYYGKSDATDATEIYYANIWGDNFETGDFTFHGTWWPYQAQWSVQGTTKYEGSYAAQCSPGATNTFLGKTVTYTTPYAVRMWVRHSGTGNYFTYLMDGYDGSYDYYPLLGYGGHFQYWNGTAAVNLPTDKTFSADTWYKVEFAVDFDNNLIRWLYIKDGDAGTAALKNYNNANATQANSLYLMGANSGGPTLYVDQVQIRKYAYPEPAWATPETELAGSATLSCDFSLPNPQAHGNINYYAYIIDSHGLQASGGEHGAENYFVVNDIRPAVSGTPTFNNSGAISLTAEKGTTDIYVRGVVTDDNGCGDTSASTTVDVYQTTLVGRTGCDNASEASGNNCYYHVTCAYDATVDSCDGGTDKTTGYKCTIPFQYYANPTDANTPWSGDNWTATFMPGDGQGPNAAGETNTAAQEMNSFLSIGFATSYGSVNFGSMDPGAHTDPLIESMRVEATGNCACNANLYGTTMTGPGTAIPIGNQRYGTGATAPAWSAGTALTGSEVLVNLGVCKSGYTATPEWKRVWWGIDVPSGQVGGDYTGTDYVVAVKKTWSSSGDWCE